MGGLAVIFAAIARAELPLNQAPGSKIQSFLPTGLAEMSQRIGRIKRRVQSLGNALTTNQRSGQPCGVRGVIETETAFHTQSVLVRRPVPALHKQDTALRPTHR